MFQWFCFVVIFERSFTDVLLIQIPNPAFSISDISFCPFQPHCHLCDLYSSWGIFITVTYLCVPLPLHFELTANATWGTRNRKYLHVAGKAGPVVCGLDLRLESVFCPPCPPSLYLETSWSQSHSSSAGQRGVKTVFY